MPRHIPLLLSVTLLIGVALGVVAGRSLPAGSVWLISFDPKDPQNARNADPPVLARAAEGAYCLYRSRRYQIGDSIYYEELDQRAVCAANAGGGVWLNVRSGGYCTLADRHFKPGSLARDEQRQRNVVCATEGDTSRWVSVEP